MQVVRAVAGPPVHPSMQARQYCHSHPLHAHPLHPLRPLPAAYQQLQVVLVAVESAIPMWVIRRLGTHTWACHTCRCAAWLCMSYMTVVTASLPSLRRMDAQALIIQTLL